MIVNSSVFEYLKKSLGTAREIAYILQMPQLSHNERRKTALVEVVTVHCGKGAALRAVGGTSSHCSC